MAWSDVELAIEWWDGSPGQGWGPIQSPPNPLGVTQFSATEKANILASLEDLYNGSEEAAHVMEESLDTQGTIRFAKSDSRIAAQHRPEVGTAPSYIVLNLDTIDNYYYLNEQGLLVEEIPSLAIIHEMIHYGLDKRDTPDPDHNGIITEDEVNSANYDQVGEVLPI